MFGLSFLAPLFLVGAAAAAIPVALHFWHRRADVVIDFPAMRYLRGATAHDSKRRRLREWLLLALRVSAILLLAVAFARPFIAAVPVSARATVILVDISASLSAPGQIERVRASAVDAVGRVPPNESVGVVTMGGAAAILVPVSPDRRAALSSIASLAAGDGAGGYAAGLARAAEALTGSPGRIVVVSDLQESGWRATDQGAVPRNVTVEVRRVEGPAGNVGIGGLRLEQGDAVASVRSFSPQGAVVPVVFDVDGRRIGSALVTLAPHATGDARVVLEPGTSGVLRAAVVDAVGYAADNARFAVLDPTVAPMVLLVTASGNPSESLYVRRALEVGEGTSAFRVRAVSGAAFSSMASDGLTGVRVVVILGTRGIDARGRVLLDGHVRAGGAVLASAGADVDPAILEQALRNITPVSWKPRDVGTLHLAPDDIRHPIFRALEAGTIDEVSVRRAPLLSVQPPSRVLARFSDGSPAVVEAAAGEGRLLVFASDLNNQENDFPLQPAFVPFVHETLGYLSGARRTRTDFLLGELPGTNGLGPGAITRADGSGAARRVALNVDVRESDPTAMTDEAFLTRVPRRPDEVALAATDRAGGEPGGRLWQYALVLMILALIAEGALGRRLA